MNNTAFSVKPVPLSFHAQLRDRWRFAFYVLLLWIIVAIYYWFGVRVDAYGILVGGFMGMFAHWHATCISELKIASANFSEGDVARWLLNRGYVSSNKPGEYMPRLHRLLRFNSQNVCVDYDGKTVKIYGPLFITKKIARMLACK
jgi:hypothetical protein